MKHLAILFICTLIVISCTDEKVTQHLNDIKTLQNKVDSSNTAFSELNMEKITEYRQNAESQMEFIEANYHDTVSFENAKYVDVYYANFRLMRKLMMNHKKLDSEITYTNSQLVKLYADVKNGLVADSTYSHYYSGEKKATDAIIESVATLKDWEYRTIKRYNGMVQPIDSIILELKNQGYRN